MAQHLAALVADNFGGVVFQIVAKAVIDGDEKPALRALLDQRGPDGVGDRIGIERVVDRSRGAGFVGQPLGAGRVQQHDPAAGIADPLHDQRLGRAGHIHDRIDMLRIEPVAGDCAGAVGAVLVIGDDELDRRAEHLATEILDRQLRRGGAALTGIRGIGARQVEDQPELDHPVGNLGGRRDRRGRGQCD